MEPPNISIEEHGVWVRHTTHGWVGRVAYFDEDVGGYRVVWETEWRTMGPTLWDVYSDSDLTKLADAPEPFWAPEILDRWRKL